MQVFFIYDLFCLSSSHCYFQSQFNIHCMYSGYIAHSYNNISKFRAPTYFVQVKWVTAYFDCHVTTLLESDWHALYSAWRLGALYTFDQTPSCFLHQRGWPTRLEYSQSGFPAVRSSSFDFSCFHVKECLCFMIP